MSEKISRRDFLKLGLLFGSGILFLPYQSSINAKPSSFSSVNINKEYLRIFSLNCWGLPFTPQKSSRINAIAQLVSSGRFDIIGLQELWFQDDWKLIYELSQRHGLSYHHYFPAGVPGSGLGVISRYPILDVDFIRFSLCGKPQNIYQGDYYSGKGIGLARLDTPFGIVDFYNTHFVARYSVKNDEDHVYRVSQAIEVVQFIKSTSKGDYIVLSGDLNSEPNTLVYEIITEIGNFIDTFDLVNPNASGYTVSQDNSYNITGLNRRIDYIFGGRTKTPLPVSDSAVFFEKIPSVGINYSDHFGIISTFDFGKKDQPNYPNNSQKKLHAIDKALKILEEGIIDSEQRQALHTNKMLAGIISIPLSSKISRDVFEDNNFGRNLRKATGYLAPVYSASQFMLAAAFTNEEINSLKKVISYLQFLRENNEVK